MENEIVLPTAVKERGMELKSLREAQAGDYAKFTDEATALSSDEKSALKSAMKARSIDIDAKATVFEADMEMVRENQANALALKSMNQIDRKVAFGDGGQTGAVEFDGRTLGQRITEDPRFAMGLQSYKSAPFNIGLEGVSMRSLQAEQDAIASGMKTTMLTTNAWAPYGPRHDGYVPAAIRQPSLRDLIPQENTESPIFYYMEETTGPTGENATYVAEGDSKPPMSLALTSRTAEVAKIAANMSISEEQLEDIPQFRAYVDNRGTLEMDLAEENALLNFTVGANKFDGFLQKAGVQTQAKGGDPTPSAVLKGMVKVQWSPGFAGMATGLAMNPVDWQNVLTLQESTGAYIWSAPSAPTAMPDMRMWGMTVRPVVALPAGTSLLGNFRMFSMLWIRSGLSIRVAWANDDAIKNLVRLIFEQRETLVISRAAAFCKVTGL